MWEVTLTARNPSQPTETADTTIRIYSDKPKDLLKNEHFRWDYLMKMMDRGTLVRIMVDYRPNFHDTRRVKRGEDGLCYLYVDGVRYGEGFTESVDAWNQGEGIVRADA